MVSKHVGRNLEHELIVIRVLRGTGPLGYVNGRRYCGYCGLGFEVVEPNDANLTRCPFCNGPLRRVPKYDKRHYIRARVNPAKYLDGDGDGHE